MSSSLWTAEDELVAIREQLERLLDRRTAGGWFAAEEQRYRVLCRREIELIDLTAWEAQLHHGAE